MIHYFDEKTRFLTAPTDDTMPPQEGGNQPALRAVLLRWDVTHPAVAALQRARKRIFVTTENPRDTIQLAFMFVSHRRLAVGLLQREVGSAVCKQPGPARHLSVPDVVRQIRINSPVYEEDGIGHRCITGSMDQQVTRVRTNLAHPDSGPQRHAPALADVERPRPEPRTRSNP